MNLQLFRQILAQAVTGITRHRLLSLAILATMSLALLAVNAMIFTSLAIDTAVAAVNRQINLTVDVKPDAEKFEVEALLSDLRARAEVREANLIPRDSAISDFRRKFPDLAEFFEKEKIDNPLSDYLTIATYDPATQSGLLAFLRTSPYAAILRVDAARESLGYRTRTEELLNFTRAIRLIGGLVGFGLLGIAAVVIYNVIRVAIFHRRGEIEIMYLVGAPLSVIRWPFVLEGIFFGVVSATAAEILFWPFLIVVSDRFAGYVPDISVSFDSGLMGQLFSGTAPTLGAFFSAHAGGMVALILTIGIAIGGVSSAIAALRHGSA